METLQQVGELGIIERISRRLPVRSDVVVSAGDDCAVVRMRAESEDDLVLTSDPVVEGVHFDAGMDDFQIGHKAAGRALSDIAAMGGEPLWGLVDIVAPGHMDAARIDAIYAGMMAVAQRHGLAIVGGDVAEGNDLQIHLFAAGRTPRDRAILRSGAKPGDLLFVTGALGGSRMGGHHSFEPRVSEGMWLREYATAMIDVSDGLFTEVWHLLKAGRVGAEIQVERVPISAAARAMDDGTPPLLHALQDGEDFELLFSAPPCAAGKMLDAWRTSFDIPCTQIGTVTSANGILSATGDGSEDVQGQIRGFEHFK